MNLERRREYTFRDVNALRADVGYLLLKWEDGHRPRRLRDFSINAFVHNSPEPIRYSSKSFIGYLRVVPRALLSDLFHEQAPVPKARLELGERVIYAGDKALFADERSVEVPRIEAEVRHDAIPIMYHRP